MDSDKWKIFLTIEEEAELDSGRYDEAKKMFTDYLIPYIPPEQYPWLIDLGCGKGDEIQALTDLGYNVVGVTIGEKTIQYAKSKYGLEYLRMDIHNLELESESFDAAVLKQVLEHTLSPWIVLMELWVILRQGGRCFIDLPSPHNKDMWTDGHPSLLYEIQLRNIFDKLGFKVIHAEESRNKTLGFNGGGDPIRYIIEKGDLPSSRYRKTLELLNTYHEMTYKR